MKTPNIGLVPDASLDPCCPVGQALVRVERLREVTLTENSNPLVHGTGSSTST